MVTALLVLVALVGAAAWPQASPRLGPARPWVRRLAVPVAVAGLALAAALAAASWPRGGADPRAVVPAAVAAAVLAGGPWASAVLEAVRRGQRLDATAQGLVLRGGAAIGALERAAVAATLLAGWPEGLAVVLAVKGLGRYDELRTSADAAERFIVGTFASTLWAAACAGTAALATG
ncbi:hypothetical protein WDZ16_08590 [Pseudokineococcus marinus]|uniref:hypothetical protein n=1 Tax=Pseudokineococcus marinus TaxID=351215 RepID=UPI0026043DEE|nr:hypothetical protein [uncultured Pseudokineococcus sp.]